jgi:hypothetical protein
MSDGDSIGGAIADSLKDLGKETGKQLVSSAASFGKASITQIKGATTDEKKAEEEKRKFETFQRVKEIEAEMKQIASQNAQKKGPEIIDAKTQSAQESDLQSKKEKKIDEALRQTLGRAEQGRNFKG